MIHYPLLFFMRVHFVKHCDRKSIVSLYSINNIGKIGVDNFIIVSTTI